MRSDLEDLYSRLLLIEDRDVLLKEIYELLGRCSEILSGYDTLLSAQEEMSRQYQQTKAELESVKRTNEILSKNATAINGQLELRNRERYGRSTEKTADITGSILSGEKAEDPLGDKETVAVTPDSDTENTGHSQNTQKSKKSRPRKTSGKREADFSKLPQKTVFLIDTDELDRQYGKNNWSIRGWTVHRSIESVKACKYVKKVFNPVISAGLEHELVRKEYDSRLLKGSVVTSSLAAEIMYGKCVMGMPFYRMEEDMRRDGVNISRTQMAGWCIRFSQELFATVYKYLCVKLLETGYSQSDETTLNVIRDGRKAGSVSYFWVHTTSELQKERPIVVFCYELTRNTDHLRNFYLSEGYTGFLTSDAYVSYGLLGEESNGTILNTGCYMHSRRRFVYALLIMNLKGKSAEYLESLPEYKAKELIDEIYAADRPLKSLSGEKRRQRRDTEVRVKVDAFFDYLHNLRDNWKDEYSEKLHDAVTYSLNNEKELRAFLDDPNVPMDNGFCERSIKPVACGRKSWIFCTSVGGAEALATLYSLSETAKANGAHPYYYYKYLLDEMQKKTVGPNMDYLEEMMPWSESYKKYEMEQKEENVKFITDQYPVTPPKSPSQNRRPLPN